MNRNVFPENIFLFVLSGIYVLIFLHFYYNEKHAVMRFFR